MSNIKMEMEWVDVNERLPEREHKGLEGELFIVLISGKNSCITSLFSAYFYCNKKFSVSNVTHWLDVKVLVPEVEFGKMYGYKGIKFMVEKTGNCFDIIINEEPALNLFKSELSFKRIHEIIDERQNLLKEQCNLFGIK